ncbi:9014_t:CDS:1, partial [Racocetra fulgida]
VEYADPLARTEACKRDVKLMKELGFNVIRVYDLILIGISYNSIYLYGYNI